jgi:hypothetical protein
MSDKETAVAVTDKPARKAAEPMMTPEDHARATGNAKRALRRVVFGNQPANYEKFSAEHNAASVMHGWSHNEHEFGEPHKLPRSAYLAALEAACTGDTPHAAAVCKVLELRANRAADRALRMVKPRHKRAQSKKSKGR